MGQFIQWAEVPGFSDADDWRVDDAEAMAVLAAPCLATGLLTNAQSAQLKAVLRQALMRWKDAGSGALASQTAGPFGQVIDTRQERRGMFWPSELDQLRSICGTASTGATSGTASTLPDAATAIHSEACSLAFGATYCSCGADLAGVPLFGV